MKNKTGMMRLRVGMSLRKEGWTECVFQISDIGTWGLIGLIVNLKENRIIWPNASNPYYVFDKKDDWILADAVDVIDRLPTISSKDKFIPKTKSH